MKYLCTQFVTAETLRRVKPGQWVKFENGARGQYLGTTRAGVDVIRWQNGKFGNNAKDPVNNALLRQYAKNSGSE